MIPSVILIVCFSIDIRNKELFIQVHFTFVNFTFTSPWALSDIIAILNYDL